LNEFVDFQKIANGCRLAVAVVALETSRRE